MRLIKNKIHNLNFIYLNNESSLTLVKNECKLYYTYLEKFFI